MCDVSAHCEFIMTNSAFMSERKKQRIKIYAQNYCGSVREASDEIGFYDQHKLNFLSNRLLNTWCMYNLCFRVLLFTLVLASMLSYVPVSALIATKKIPHFKEKMSRKNIKKLHVENDLDVRFKEEF